MSTYYFITGFGLTFGALVLLSDRFEGFRADISKPFRDFLGRRKNAREISKHRMEWLTNWAGGDTSSKVDGLTVLKELVEDPVFLRVLEKYIDSPEKFETSVLTGNLKGRKAVMLTKDRAYFLFFSLQGVYGDSAYASLSLPGLIGTTVSLHAGQALLAVASTKEGAQQLLLQRSTESSLVKKSLDLAYLRTLYPDSTEASSSTESEDLEDL